MGDLDAVIEKIHARWILDSRGNPTIETEVFANVQNLFARAAVPSGASTGTHEALELRDNNSEFKGKGVKQAIQNVNQKIAPKLLDMNVFEQNNIDKTMIELDGTPNKATLGANAILSVSLAVAKLAAKVKNVPLYKYVFELSHTISSNVYLLPIPMANIINGGKHAGNDLAIQEFMVLPINFKTFHKAIQATSEIYQSLKEILKRKYGKTAINVGDEGGFAPNLNKSQEAFEILISAIENANYTPKTDVIFAIDAAANEFYTNGTYQIDGKQLNPGELIDYYQNLVKLYPIGSIEDPFQEDDFENTAELTDILGSNVMIVGDDLFVSQEKRLQVGIDNKAANCILLKVNQCGSLSEAISTAKLALFRDYRVIVSHRSGETEDTFIADLAVGLNGGLIKTGASARSERTCKYNQLLRIEEELAAQAVYAGTKVDKSNLIFND
ncbi:MAG: phosphopyruvate hydratase [Candidatus Helarchaeota archaeon]|nr:phosphopyruvate hydratase [Candidatus Helarchaeota archaeon]